jgi:hypothetical protein
VRDPAAQRARVKQIAITALKRRDTFLCGLVMLLFASKFERWFREAVEKDRAADEGPSPFMYTMY